jgi:hypothetical protein
MKPTLQLFITGWAAVVLVAGCNCGRFDARYDDLCESLCDFERSTAGGRAGGFITMTGGGIPLGGGVPNGGGGFSGGTAGGGAGGGKSQAGGFAAMTGGGHTGGGQTGPTGGGAQAGGSTGVGGGQAGGLTRRDGGLTLFDGGFGGGGSNQCDPDPVLPLSKCSNLPEVFCTTTGTPCCRAGVDGGPTWSCCSTGSTC